MEWRERDGVRWLEATMPGARAAFSTRIGGVSQPPFDELNLGLFTADERGAVVENRRRLAGALGFPPERVAIGRQMHGHELATHAGAQEPSPFADPGSPIPEVDGHLTALRDLPLLVFVADCVPIALSGPGGVAMLHCGWRGMVAGDSASPGQAKRDTTAGLVARAAAAVGATDAAIGPSIRPCCYEVGEAVLGAFAGLGHGIAAGRMLDLSEVARRLLLQGGVERIETARLCTSCEPELFFSHRRDASLTGRQAGVVWRDEEVG
ncbi:MAG TPA: polyphenol oxidase family protein [Solirubrobacterales bacterium]|jgi:YfiH family protein